MVLQLSQDLRRRGVLQLTNDNLIVLRMPRHPCTSSRQHWSGVRCEVLAQGHASS